MFEATVREGACRLRRPGTRWLSTGHAGGESRGPAAYNLSVPDGWTETDLDAYVADRLDRAGFDEPGPTLLTGVSLDHARRARLGSVEAVVTAGVSNPAALPVPASDASAAVSPDAGRDDADADADADCTPDTAGARPDSPGTVNVFVGTTRALEPGALSNLLTVAAEAKAATLLARAGVPGTTTDAVVAACDPAGDPASFSGSATPVGRAARACVRDALSAGLDSRYDDREASSAVADADHGVVTARRAEVTEL